MTPVAAGAVSGLLSALALPPFHLWPLAFVALAPLAVALSMPLVDRRSAALAGIGFGAVFHGVALHWVPFTLHGLMPFGALFGLLALVLLAGVGGAQAVLLRRLIVNGVTPVLALPAVWVAAEVALAHAGPLAFPWTPLGLALARAPEWAGASEWVGVEGLTFWITAVSGTVAHAVLAPTFARRWTVAVLGAVLVAGPAAAGAVRARSIEMTPLPRILVGQLHASRDTLRVGALRDVSIGRALDVLVRGALESRDDAASPPVVSLVVLPEAPFAGSWAAAVRPGLRRHAAAFGVEVLVGARIADDDLAAGAEGLRNAIVTIEPSGPIDLVHAKRRLVPGVESPGLVAGPAGGVLSTEAGRIGLLVCFEIAFSRDARTLRRGGADLLVNPTNDGWFAPGILGRPAAAHAQHRAHLVLRAIESRVGVVRSSLGGETLVVDPIGRLLVSSPVGAEGFFPVTPLTSAAVTLHTRFGDLGAWAGGALFVLLLLNPFGPRRILQSSAPE